MFSLFQGASLKIAKNLIKVTGVQEGLSLFLKISPLTMNKQELFIQILALNATNLLQTMKEDFISREIDSEDSQDIVDDYVVETLRHQEFIQLRDGAELMEKCQEIEGLAQKFRVHWMGEMEHNGPEPLYFCVMDVLRKFENEKNHYLQDALYDFITVQHKHFTHYFQTLLLPIDNSESKVTEETPQPPLSFPAPDTSEPSIFTEDIPNLNPQESAVPPENSPASLGPDYTWLEQLFPRSSEIPTEPESVSAPLDLQGQALEETSPYPEIDLIKKGFNLPKMEKPFHL